MLIEFLLVYSMNEMGTANKFRNLLVTGSFSPGFRVTLSQLEHYLRIRRHVPIVLGLSMAKMDRRKRSFNRVCGSSAEPVAGGEAIEI